MSEKEWAEKEGAEKAARELKPLPESEVAPPPARVGKWFRRGVIILLALILVTILAEVTGFIDGFEQGFCEGRGGVLKIHNMSGQLFCDFPPLADSIDDIGGRDYWLNS
ncbi:MAG: hypothetical protein F4Z36_09450 [Acidimicrobiia bacterium]|nr:hypothetical protein [bacterium]MXX65263.1 hypothetical protein [Acidimicrobiia bacterium]MYD04278.1 hypothetical protein [Acidimicrobiia bacterium]